MQVGAYVEFGDMLKRGYKVALASAETTIWRKRWGESLTEIVTKGKIVQSKYIYKALGNYLKLRREF